MAKSKVTPQQSRLNHIIDNIMLNSKMPTIEEIKELDDSTFRELYRFSKNEPKEFTSESLRMIENYRKGKQ